MLKLRISFLFCLFSLATLVRAQETIIYQDPVQHYNKALELYDKEKFGAAIQAFETFLEQNKDFQLSINSRYYIAFCHLELEQAQGEQQILDLLEQHSDHPKANFARFMLGKAYYKKGNNSQSIKFLEQVVAKDLSPEERKTYHFAYGYALFLKNEYDKAREQFSRIEYNKDKYYYPTQYYMGYMDLNEGKDENALKRFKNLYTSKVYSDLAMKLSCQAYYRLGKYQELISFSDTIKTTTYSEDIIWERGKAFYQLGKYSEASEQLTAGRGTRDLMPEDYYIMGFTAYQLEQYEKAFLNFNLVTASELKQNALMYAADCYLKLDKKTNARNAFYEASRIDTDKNVQELAYFNYAKLSMEPPFQNEAVNVLGKFLNQYPNSKYADEAKGYLGEALLSAKKYSDAIPVLESIVQKTDKIKRTYQQICYLYANELLRQSPDDALIYFSKARTYPLDLGINAQIDFWEGEIYYKKGKVDLAIENWLSFLDNPQASQTRVYLDGLYNLAYGYFDKKEYRKAIGYFKQYTEKESYGSEKRSKYLDGMTRLADCYYVTEQYDAAVNSYAFVTSKEAANSDYALFQTGMIYGIQGKVDAKVNTMKRIPVLFPNSEYVYPASYQVALVELQRQEYRSAKNAFSILVQDYPNGIYAKSCFLHLGLVEYNLNNKDAALSNYKTVVERYQRDAQTDEAIEGIKLIMNEQGRGEELIDYLREVAKTRISVSYEDSTIYNSAYQHYVAQNCNRAIADFGNYLRRFPDGFFMVQAEFYRAECLYAQNSYEEAQKGYVYVVEKKFPEFYERSLRRSAAIYLWQKKGNEAIPVLIELEKVATAKDNILFAQVNLMYQYLELDELQKAKTFAEKVLSNDKAQKAELRDANLIMGRVLLLDEKYDTAKPYFEKVEKDKENRNAKGAEAKYYLCYILYKKGDLKKAQEEVYKLDETYANQLYWVAKGYLLIAQTYLDQKDLMNARAVLNSLLENYPLKNDGIHESCEELLQFAEKIEHGQ